MATSFESGYGAFLPQYQNEYVDREALRGQMVKQASYLSEMDTVYAQLDESARQFDVSAAERVREFDITAEYNRDTLAENARQFDENIALGWARHEGEMELGRGELEINRGRLAVEQYNARTGRMGTQAQIDIAERGMDLQEDQFAAEQDAYNTSSSMLQDFLNDLGDFAEPSSPSNLGSPSVANPVGNPIHANTGGTYSSSPNSFYGTVRFE